MQISCEIYYMGKQLTLAENPLGGFPAGASVVSSHETNADRYRYCRQEKRELKLSSHIIGLTIVRSQNQLKQVEPTYAISFVVYFNNIISLKQQIVKPFQKKDFLQVLLEL